MFVSNDVEQVCRQKFGTKKFDFYLVTRHVHRFAVHAAACALVDRSSWTFCWEVF